MTTTDYPEIQHYGYIYRAILMAQDDKSLTAVGDCIAATVSTDHAERPYLVEAGQMRREEIRLKIESRKALEIELAAK